MARDTSLFEGCVKGRAPDTAAVFFFFASHHPYWLSLQLPVTRRSARMRDNDMREDRVQSQCVFAVGRTDKQEEARQVNMLHPIF